jgi:type I site-specific restriction endonuclease
VDLVVFIRRVGSRRLVEQIAGVDSRVFGDVVPTFTIFDRVDGDLRWRGRRPADDDDYTAAGMRWP